MSLVERGVLDEYDVELIGASAAAINAGEDRDEFKDVVERCGAEVARSVIAHTMDECRAGVDALGGYPVVVRPSFTMGGLGSGVAFNDSDLHRIAGAGLAASRTTEVLLEESILGWKEYELELMRDTADNVVVVCSIENVDPVGVQPADAARSVPVEDSALLVQGSHGLLKRLGVGTADGHGLSHRLHGGGEPGIGGPPPRRPPSNRPWTTWSSRCRASPSRSSGALTPGSPPP